MSQVRSPADIRDNPEGRMESPHHKDTLGNIGGRGGWIPRPDMVGMIRRNRLWAVTRIDHTQRKEEQT